MKKTCSYPESRSVIKRIAREKKNLELMISMYCDRHHSGGSSLCDECQQVLNYAGKRLEQCPFKHDKPTCANCTVHCYKPDIRQKVREIMRYSGPRMAYRHPVLAFHHLIDGRRRPKGGNNRWQENSNQPKP